MDIKDTDGDLTRDLREAIEANLNPTPGLPYDDEPNFRKAMKMADFGMPSATRAAYVGGAVAPRTGNATLSDIVSSSYAVAGNSENLLVAALEIEAMLLGIPSGDRPVEPQSTTGGGPIDRVASNHSTAMSTAERTMAVLSRIAILVK